MMIFVLKILGIIVLSALAAAGVLIVIVMARAAWIEEKQIKRAEAAVERIIKEIEEEAHEQSDPDGETD